MPNMTATTISSNGTYLEREPYCVFRDPTKQLATPAGKNHALDALPRAASHRASKPKRRHLLGSSLDSFQEFLSLPAIHVYASLRNCLA